MSWQTVSWALRHAPVPEDDPARMTTKFVLVVLAEHADESGANAYPAMETVAQLLGVSRDTVRRALKRLSDAGLIYAGDQSITAWMRSDRRPKVWNLRVERGGTGATPCLERGGTGAPSTPGGRGVTGAPPQRLRGGTGATNGVAPVPPEPPMNQNYSRARSNGQSPGSPPSASTPIPPPVEAFKNQLGAGSTAEGRARARAMFPVQSPMLVPIDGTSADEIASGQ